MNLSERCAFLEGMLDDLAFKFNTLRASVKSKMDAERRGDMV